MNSSTDHSSQFTSHVDQFDPELVATSAREASVPPVQETITYLDAIAECDRLQSRINEIRRDLRLYGVAFKPEA